MMSIFREMEDLVLFRGIEQKARVFDVLYIQMKQFP